MKPNLVSSFPMTLALALAILLSPSVLMATPPPARTIVETHYVLTNRQKYVELRGFCDPVYDPDELIWTIVSYPSHGDLDYVVGATWRYTPAEEWTGQDSFTCRCIISGGTYANTATITLIVDDDFVLPYGLGAPDFGIEEDVDDYQRDADQEYYVDLEEGVDEEVNPDWPNGSQENPRLTIPTTLEAGDLVTVQGCGTSDAPLDIFAPGTEEAPIFIRGDREIRAFLLQGLVIHGDYVIVENIDFDAQSENPESPQNQFWFQVKEEYLGSNTWSGREHVAIRHCSFYGHPTGQDNGVSAMIFGATHCSSCTDPPSPDDDETLIEDCVVYDTFVGEFGDWQAETDEDYGACAFNPNSRNMWCLDSVFHHIQGSGVAMSRNNALSEQAPARNCYAGRNVIHHVKEFAFNCKMTQSSIISQNKVYRIRKSASSSTGAAISIDNDDHCNSHENTTTYLYSDNVWVIFNHIYDVQAGLLTSQQIHCGGTTCCCPDLGDSCCSGEGGDPEPEYGNSRIYVVGNLFHHIDRYGATPATSHGIACLIGNQVQARIVNNTIYKCLQGIYVTCTHNTGECPSGGDPDNETRNTSVAVMNNVFLDILNSGDNDAHVRVCTGPYSGDPDLPFTLTDTEFDRNLHYGTYRAFVLPTFTYSSVDDLQGDEYTDYGTDSKGDDTTEDNPHLENPGSLLFDLTGSSPSFMATGGANDIAYNDFEVEFGLSIYYDYEKIAFSTNTPPIGAFRD